MQRTLHVLIGTALSLCVVGMLLSVQPYGFQAVREEGNNDVFIGIKTTSKFFRTRADDILRTWHRFAPDQIAFFADDADPGELASTPVPHPKRRRNRPIAKTAIARIRYDTFPFPIRQDGQCCLLLKTPHRRSPCHRQLMLKRHS